MTPSVFSHTAENARNYTRGILISRCKSEGLLNQSVIALQRRRLFSSYRRVHRDLRLYCCLVLCSSHVPLLKKKKGRGGHGGKTELSHCVIQPVSSQRNLRQYKFVPNWIVVRHNRVIYLNTSQSRTYRLWQHFLCQCSTPPIHGPLPPWLSPSPPPPSSPHHYLYGCPPSSLSFSC